jgi:hypothetical protein
MCLPLISNAQEDILTKVKHIEIVSEVADTMALLNKDDVNKINKVFYERNYLDSLRIVNTSLLQANAAVKEKMDSIVSTQLNTINNQGLIIKQYQEIISENNTEIANLETQHKKDKNRKIAWQSVSGTLGVVILVILLL